MPNKIINGGLELKPKEDASSSSSSFEEKQRVVTNFDPVSSMLNDPSSVLGLITASSLKGFIFKLDVQDGKSSYTEYNLGSRTQVEVKNFALKFVVISDVETKIGDFNGRKKLSDTEKMFTSEAMMQQEIWKETYLTEGGEIAPSVGNITFLEGGDSIITFLTELKRKDNVHVDAVEVVNFLIDVFEKNKKYKLGILLMKNYSESKPFIDYINAYKSEKVKIRNGKEFKEEAKEKYLTVRRNILIKVLRLALLGYIHLDLHSGNSLNTDDSSVIIDYGRAVSIKDHPNGNYTIENYINYIGENAFDRFLQPIGYGKIKQYIDENRIYKSNDNKDYKLKKIMDTSEQLFESLKILGKIIKENKVVAGEKEEREIAFFESTIDHIERLDAYNHLFITQKFVTQMGGITHEFHKYFTRQDLYGNGFYKKLIKEMTKIPLIQPSNVKASLVLESNAERREEEEEKVPKTTKPTPILEKDEHEEQLAKPNPTKQLLENKITVKKSATKSRQKSATKSRQKTKLATIKEEDEDDARKGFKPKLSRSQEKEVEEFAEMFNLSSGGKTIKKRTSRIIKSKFLTKRRGQVSKSKSKSKKNKNVLQYIYK